MILVNLHYIVRTKNTQKKQIFMIGLSGTSIDDALNTLCERTVEYLNKFEDYQKELLLLFDRIFKISPDLITLKNIIKEYYSIGLLHLEDVPLFLTDYETNSPYHTPESLNDILSKPSKKIIDIFTSNIIDSLRNAPTANYVLINQIHNKYNDWKTNVDVVVV